LTKALSVLLKTRLAVALEPSHV